jgi:hypothetical protein
MEQVFFHQEMLSVKKTSPQRILNWSKAILTLKLYRCTDNVKHFPYPEGECGSMKITRLSRVVASILAVCFIGYFVVAASQLRASAHSVHTSIVSHNANTSITTNCPAPGTANAAVMPSITLGTHPNIVYIVDDVIED